MKRAVQVYCQSMKKRITMQSIADACGVSRNAVSIALRGGEKGVSQATAKRIRDKAEELGYVPDPELSRLAKRLGERKRKEGIRGELAYLVPLIEGKERGEGMMYQEICQEQARRLGYRLVPYYCGLGQATPQQLQQVWQNRGVQGVMVFSPFLRELTGENTFDWDAFSWVACSDSLQSPLLHRFNWDFREAVTLCYEKLFENGYRRIGLVMNDTYDRLVGYAGTGAHALYQARCPKQDQIPRLAAVEMGNPAMRLELFQGWLEAWTPDAVIGLSDTEEDLRSLGYRIPEDIAYATFRLRTHELGKIAGVLPGFETLAKTAIELLVSQVDHQVKGLPQHPLRTLVEGEWRDGSSVLQGSR